MRPPMLVTPNPPMPAHTSRISSPKATIAAIVLLAASIAGILFLRAWGNSAALICFENRVLSTSNPSSRALYPRIDWGRVPPIPPSSSFRSERWIVVSISSHTAPDDPTLYRLSRIDGWQLLAVGDSRTPSNWSINGAIFLSVEQQARLGFRVVDHLSHLSYPRKTAGYLFAIQHGAKKIFDADGRGDVIGGDLGRIFDLDLIGDANPLKNSVLLQYSHQYPNRTVVNPYVHFGQRSVWPRGLPLENVGDVAAEEFYIEIFSGKQFIQQGLTSGLPDVDSTFYHTRKSGFEPLDIAFDAEAPKVAVPQGMMVPVNSFNALFDKQAFWGLMLPVSVSPIASDVMRGYWAQRILWEIGGHVAVCPPTVHRLDRSESYPFAEEEDIHVNVGRLIKFLNSWRSRRHTLFEKILDLSSAMEEAGFWKEQDVAFTAYWLQDLIAVGYQQPRLMSLEIDLPRATIGHGDRKAFVPRKLPSMHLGVEEVEKVNSRVDNLIRWRKHFGKVVLIMYCSGSVERTSLEWRLLYGRIFKTVVILSDEINEALAVEYGFLAQAYKYLPRIFERYAGADGFLFLQDSVVLNYWSLLEANKRKLWITNKVPESWVIVSIGKESENWFQTQAALVHKLVSALPGHFRMSYEGSVVDGKLTICGSEIFYVPHHFVGDFRDLVRLVGDLDIHHMIAVPLFFMAMDSQQNFDSDALRMSIYKKNLPSNTSYASYYSAHAPAVYPCDVHSEAEFVKLLRIMASGDPLLSELV